MFFSFLYTLSKQIIDKLIADKVLVDIDDAVRRAWKLKEQLSAEIEERKAQAAEEQRQAAEAAKDDDKEPEGLTGFAAAAAAAASGADEDEDDDEEEIPEPGIEEIVEEPPVK